MSDAPARHRGPNGGYFPWYDSVWLSVFEHAKYLIAKTKPEILGDFVDAFARFRAPDAFEARLLPAVFDEETMGEIRQFTAKLAPTQLDYHEALVFKRGLLHTHPFFAQLQERLVDLVSEATGERVESAYNFLSLYGPKGICPLHLDSPEAKWTVDLCISQSAPWPIHFSRVLPWPQRTQEQWGIEGWDDQLKRDPASGFRSVSMNPGEAVLFSGASQWHYRDEMPGGAANRYCDLLFFHFIPEGTAELVNPHNWARLFSMPELEACAIK